MLCLLSALSRMSSPSNLRPSRPPNTFEYTTVDCFVNISKHRRPPPPDRCLFHGSQATTAPPERPSGSFGDYVKRRRETLGLTATALADQLGVSKSFVSLIESGARVPGEAHVRRLAEILGDDPDALAAWVRGEGLAGDTAEDLFIRPWNLWPGLRLSVPSVHSACPVAPVNVEVRLASPQAISFERPSSARH